MLELGCGSGRDSKHFLNRGYPIKAIDLSPELAAAASNDIIIFSFLTLKIGVIIAFE
ncbi:MAG: methyltransferase domain-containing protein [Cetobacterium sp.]